MNQDKVTFSFGKNWEAFVNSYFTEERISISKTHILNFLQTENLNGKYFLDVGCGSGLSSLAALEAGAERIVSFDVDPYSVKTTQRLKELRGNPNKWQILQGSVLDKKFMASIEPADVLYSWGVLHHTGSMWEAIENTMSLVKRNGVFYIALYTTTPQSPYWIKVKQDYNRGSQIKKTVMEMNYLRRFMIAKYESHYNPIAYIRDQIKYVGKQINFIKNYKKSRGMAFMTDVRDWLGGWPYEDATVEEATTFFDKHDFRLVRIKAGEANTEYLFARK